MLESILGICGLVVGSVLAWLLASSRHKLAAQKQQSSLASQLASAESALEEVRHQFEDQQQTVTQLREQLDEQRQQCTQAQTKLEESSSRFEAQQRSLDDAQKKLKDSFEALSAKALQTNTQQFLAVAKKSLEVVMSDAKGDLGKREEAIKGLVKPIADALKRYETQIQNLEKSRQSAYGSLQEQVKAMAVTNKELQLQAGQLATALRDPKVRGQWGELALKRAAELAGMSEHCDFEQQVSVDTDDGTYRPDMVVRLPGGRSVVIDAKAVLQAYLDAVGAPDEAARRLCLSRHAQQVRSRVRELSSKSYWDKLGITPEFVVLFLPGESFFSAAVDVDPTLIEDAIESKVILASPTTLIALLRAIAYGWRQEQVAENAEIISQLGRELYDRMHAFVTHFEKIGKNLSRSVEAYNSAVGSLEHRILPSTRRFKELGAAGGDDIADIQPIDLTSRHLDAPRSDVA